MKNIPSHYIHFNEDLDTSGLFASNKGLCVITGKNGSGKTQLLSYINEEIKSHAKNNQTTLFKTTNSSMDNKSKRYYMKRNWYRLPEEEEEDDDINEFLHNIIRRRPIRSSSNINTIWELRNILFNFNNFYYKNRNDVLSIIFEELDSKYHFTTEDIELFKNNIGYPTEEQIKEVAQSEYKKSKNIKNWSQKKKEDFNSWYNNNIKDNRDKWFQEVAQRFDTNKIKIQSWEQFLEYLEQLFNPFRNTNNLFILEQIIKNDYFKHKKPDKDSIVAKINLNYLKSENFPYHLITPHKSTEYELVFQHKNSKVTDYIPFNKLSTGEKALFELCCYQYLAEEQKKELKYILLDEFDANLNPILIDTYIDILNELKKQYKIIVTTHNPVTVAKVESSEIFELCKDKCKLVHAKDDKGRKEILEKLAPNFIVQDELGFIGILAKTKKAIIIFCEGKYDKFYLEDAIKNLEIEEKYTIIDCEGAENIKNITKSLKVIPFFKNLIINKNILALFDFDEKAHKCGKNLYGSDFQKDIYKGKVKDTKNMYFMLLTPPNYIEYNTSSTDKAYTIEHLHVHNVDTYKNKKLSDSDKKSIKTAVEKGEYIDYSKFKELFEEIDELISWTKKTE